MGLFGSLSENCWLSEGSAELSSKSCSSFVIGCCDALETHTVNQIMAAANERPPHR